MLARRHRSLLLLAALAALVPCLVVCAGGAPAPGGEKAPPPRPAQKPSLPAIEALVKDQKLAEAVGKLATLITEARARGDEDGLAYALAKKSQLQIALGEFETAVKELKAAAWPTAPVPALAVELYYANSLTAYLRAYSWEIGQREKIDQKAAPKTVELKSWTRDQIVAEATRSYAAVYQRRAELGTRPVGALAPYLTPNTYPENVRGTLRDAATYLAVAHLADSSLWRADESNELFRVSLEKLLGDAPESAALDGASHPIVRVVAALADLEAFHAKAGHGEAALEARLERLRRLYTAFTDKKERAAIERALVARLGTERQRSWWAMGQALLAEWTRARNELVRAHQLATEGLRAFPASMGGAICAEIVAGIEAPDYGMAMMSVDALGKKSLTVTARNLPRLHFRAYAVDLAARLTTSKDYNLLLDADEMQALLGHRPAAEWTVQLPATPDYRSHRTHVTLPMKKKGFYVIVASARPGFEQEKNRRLAAQIMVSDLVLSTRTSAAGRIEATVFDGPSGRLTEGATVELWEFDWQHGHRRLGQQRADHSGAVRFDAPSGKPVFLVASRGADLTCDANFIYAYRQSEEPTRTSTLIYTDRSVYRPGQTVRWKAIVYSGRSKDGRFQVAPGKSLSISLRDANHQEVHKLEVTTSAYGSAAGELNIPASGRLLGGWTIVSSLSGTQSIRVEEYKRPTFEVSLKPPAESLRLNVPAKLLGEARYYFGLPVTAGTARYTVTREPVYPYWWSWYWSSAPSSQRQTIARGSAPLTADGSFEVKFLPEVGDQTDPSVTYRYTISADVTDEGGETRSASRGYRLGVATVEATLSTDLGFFDAKDGGSLSLHRADLDGTPRAGKGSYRVLRLSGPAHALLPIEQSALGAGARQTDEDGGENVAEGPLLTEGDRQRARFESSYAPLQALALWKDGAVVARGELAADDHGLATIKLGALPAGAYRVRYETTDERGKKAETFRDVIFAGEQAPPLAALLRVASSTVQVGDKLRLLAQTGLSDQTVLLDTFRSGELIDRRVLVSPRAVIERTMTEADRGGLAFVMTLVRDHQLVTLSETVSVPWDNQSLKLSYASFRDMLRPGARETFRVTVEGEGKHKGRLGAGAAELLAYMYDRSLDLFAPHHPPSPLSLFPWRAHANIGRATLGQARGSWLGQDHLREVSSATRPQPDRFQFEDGYAIGGLGMRGHGVGGGGRARNMFRSEMAPPSQVQAMPAKRAPEELKARSPEERSDDRDGLAQAEKAEKQDASTTRQAAAAGEAGEPVRSNFAETAFWQPTLLLDSKGEASFEFVVPDSVTSWNVWVHAITKDLRSGSLNQQTRSVKDLMVRPYLPRFFREGDEAELKVVVNNAGKTRLEGKLTLDIQDPATRQSRAAEFAVGAPGAAWLERAFVVEPGKSTSVGFPVRAPRRVDTYAFLVKASAQVGKDTFSDGELRPVPVLPSRLHLTQSRFVTLRDTDKRTMKFDDLARSDDASRVNEQLVVTLDAQLFYTVLRALPYLINYPYECAEQTLNRFVSTAIVSSLFGQYPQVAKMADQMSRRTSQLQAWDTGDANRKMALEEAPFLFEAKGGHDPAAKDAARELELVNVLDQRIARASRDSALEKLGKMQTSLGAFPWFPGGPPSPYMTLYVLYGFAKAAEFKVDVPKPMVQRGWQYLARHYREEYAHRMLKDDCCWEFLALLNYVASSYPDPSWTGDALTLAERKQILEHTFKHWRQTAPYVKGLLALTLKRMGRAADGKKVFDSVMDSAKTAQDQGTFWAPEDRSWLWYNDTIESHAFALRVLMELDPKSPKKDGLVLWLLLNKKLNQWKSTRATAEVIYSLAKYMEADKSLGVREAATVSVGARQQTYTFEPDRYVGKVQLVVPGPEVNERSASVTVEKQTKGVMFASATWSFATDKLPSEGRGDFFTVSRQFFLRENNGREYTLKPLAEATMLKPGDEVEVQLAITSKHEAEYVHLRDPRGAGFEPVSLTSRYKWDLGLGYYEEVRDSGMNFFFERLPAGQYTFKHRLRATTGGKFRVGPATLQSMYAPEFSAYSAGRVIAIGGAQP